MNILLLNWQDVTNPLSGGAEVHLHEIFKRIAARGHSITLFCSWYSGAAADEVIDGIRIMREGGRNLFNYRVYPRYMRQFRSQFDIIVDDINKIPFYTPLFVREPLVGILHHFFGKSIFAETHPPGALYVLGAEWLAQRVYRNTPMAVVSESTKQELLSYGFREENLFLVPNCVDHIAYTLGHQDFQGHVIGYLGRLKNYKSIEDLLQAFAIVLRDAPDARLVIVGEGDARKTLERVARGIHITGKVEFRGFVPLEEKVRLLRSMNFVVNPSSKEGWGLTVIEANACGVPVIASDVPGLCDSVLDDKTGLLYEYGNIEQLAAKMLLLLRDRALRSRLSVGALEWAQQFDWNNSAEAMLTLLESKIHRSARTGRSD
ncbi:MAG: glycosyltransferase family 4 protein [Ignavibacteriales bacterium]|nr:glycosyltransferase family 4 protein [Ignavibacteriales bacterium]